MKLLLLLTVLSTTIFAQSDIGKEALFFKASLQNTEIAQIIGLRKGRKYHNTLNRLEMISRYHKEYILKYRGRDREIQKRQRGRYR